MISNGAGHEEGGSSNKLEGEKTQKMRKVGGDNVGKGHVRGPKAGNTSGQQRK